MKIKVVHEFDSVEDAYDYETIVNAIKFKRAIVEFDEQLRYIIKHVETDSTKIEALETARVMFYNVLQDENLSLHE